MRRDTHSDWDLGSFRPEFRAENAAELSKVDAASSRRGGQVGNMPKAIQQEQHDRPRQMTC